METNTDPYLLSEGSLRTIMQGGQVDSPIMQVLGTKKIATINSDKERYRVLVSDGKHYISFAMFTTQINEQVESGELDMFSIIKIKRYITSIINNTGKSDKRVLVILELEIVASGDKVNKRIGSPEQLPDNEISQPNSNGVANVHGKTNGAGPMATSSTAAQPAKQNNINLNQSLQQQLTHPISSLSPYQNKWVIRARVNNKSNIRTWSNSRGEGKLFTLDLVDETGEIRATAFKDAVDKFYDNIEVDKIYYISKCQLKMANKQFTSLKNDYEMNLTNETVIQLCEDDVGNIPQVQYNFVPIDHIGNIEAGTFIDVIGVSKATSELFAFQAKSTGRELKKKEVTLVDQTDNAIALILWGTDAESFDGSSNSVIVIKGARIGEFGGGKYISTSSDMKINPDIPEAHKLRGWYDNYGVNNEVKNLRARIGGNFQTPWMNFREVKDQSLGNSEKGDYYQVHGTILLLRSENLMYKACPLDDCNKKIIDMENGMFRCEKCSKEYPNFKHRLLGSVNVGDSYGSQWMSMFSSEVEKIIGLTAVEVGESEGNKTALAEIADKANFKRFILKCRAKFEMYNDENRLNTVAVKVDPVNYKEHNSYLISRINQLLEK